MSSLLSSLDMSLDDLIQKKKTTGKGRKESGAGPVRRNRPNAGRGRRDGTPYSRKGDDGDVDMDEESNKPPRGGRTSILSRIGGKAQEDIGHKVFVSNLKFDVLEDDIKELFSTVGKVVKHEIIYDRSGRSKGQARVWFSNKRAAEAAVTKYDGRTLDNQAMKITLDDGNNQSNSNKKQDSNNVRSGLFGTALQGATGDVDFKVTFNGNRGGRRNRRGGGRGRGGGESKTSAADLDDDMDTYMNKN
ncbi:hypothetical protein THRCLA_23381 [Thraustotheca clavata]|uniref:RRM domain-containing protein n=1 Tax=Thraustotheca clavata TaxID=74557 RepID=A0A1V9Y6Q6_9STRA|nr:hypothetical protein THRCLA_23381 [Thraustotheca clavata]